MTTPTPMPVELAALTDAIEQHDGDAAVLALNAIAATYGQPVYDLLLDGLIVCGVGRLADLLKAGDPDALDTLRHILTATGGA